MRRPALVAFLGPSLTAAAARAAAPGVHVLPPARQGDVWRALALRPRAIALIDGVFESEPSVWHRELLGALKVYRAEFKNISMLGKNAIIGRGVIIHAKPDDGGQPVGNAGARIGFGSIGVANPKQ